MSGSQSENRLRPTRRRISPKRLSHPNFLKTTDLRTVHLADMTERIGGTTSTVVLLLPNVSTNGGVTHTPSDARYTQRQKRAVGRNHHVIRRQRAQYRQLRLTF